MYKLDVLAELTGNVEIAITLDGSKLTKKLKLDTLLLPTDVETSGNSSIQSCNNSYVVEINLMKDTKEGYKQFTSFLFL